MDKEIKDFPLTHQQNRIWYIQKFYPDSSIWNLSYTVKFKNEADPELIEKAINLTLEQNDSLRLRFNENEGTPFQYISGYDEKNLDYFDFTPYGEQEYSAWLKYNSSAPFRLIDNDLFYFAVIKFNDGSMGFLLKIHHIICDGWSAGLIINRIFQNYNKLIGVSSSEKILLNPPLLKEETPYSEIKPEVKAKSYTDYIAIEQNYLGSDNFQKDRKYWNDIFAGVPEPLSLITHPRTDDIKTDRLVFTLTDKITDKLYEYKDKNNISIFRIILAAFYTYLLRITGKDDIVFGTGTHNRVTSDLKAITGMFANLLPFRITTDGNIAFEDLLNKIDDGVNHAIKHQGYPYDLLIKDLRQANKNQDDLFNIAVVQYFKSLYPDDIEVTFNHNGNSDIPITLYLSYNPYKKDDIEFFIDYQTSIFDKEEIKSLCKHVANIIRAGLDTPDKDIAALNLLTEKEKNKLIYGLNQNQFYYPKNKIIQDLFEEQVKKNPDKLALVYKDKKLTYKELNQRANQIARIIRAKEVKPDEIVGILVDRSLEMIVGVMGIIKSGAAYMPIDPEYPADRIEYMIEDSRTKILLSQKHLSGKINFQGTFINLDKKSLYSGDDSDIPKINKPTDLAYIIYTSGSTGKPKGVMIEHHSLLNLSIWYKNFHDLKEQDNTTKYACFGFDASVWEIFPSIITGCTLHIISDDIRISPYDLNDYFDANNITVSYLPTQMCEQFMDTVDNKSLRWLDTGGDKLRLFKKKKFVMANNYGPTEYTVCTSGFKVDKYYENIPIGKPIANTRVYILDKFNNLVPQGIPGELCVSGPGAARGYLNRADLTGQKFLPDPFIRGNQKMYKTGDLARWLPDGNLEYLGRIDQQVKIRGFRIELGEIEQALINVPYIKDAAVSARDDRNSNKFLCAYIVAENEIDKESLKKELAKSLPYYMIPVYFVQMQKLPLTPNGKVDRKILPDPLKIFDSETKKTKVIKPHNKIERRIFDIWEKILSKKDFGINDNFFSIGGHSLQAGLLLGMLKKEFETDISLRDIFKYPTIRQLTKYIAEIMKTTDGLDGDDVNETEKKLLSIIKDVLGLKSVSITDDLFVIGADSLKTAMIQAKINKAFSIGLPIKNIIKNPIIADLAEFILNAIHAKAAFEKSESTPFEKGGKGDLKDKEILAPPLKKEDIKKEYYPASSVQKGLFILEQFESINTTYNVPVALDIEGRLDKGKLGECILAMIERHESLRTSFDIKNGEPVQIIHPRVKIKKYYSETDESEVDYIMQEFIKPFNLKKAPLFRVELIRTGEGKFTLLLDFHHIIFDGFSLGIFIRELFDLYQGKDLAPLKIQYKEFAEWQQKYTGSDQMKISEEFWGTNLRDHSVLNLPTDYLRTPGMDFSGSEYGFFIDRSLTSSIKRLAFETRKTVFVTLLTAFNVMLARYSSQEDIIVGTPMAGRRTEDFHQVIGMFVNTLPIRAFPKYEKTFNALMDEIHDSFLNVYDNQDYQFENLIRKLNLDRESDRNPLFDVVFALQDTSFTSAGNDLNGLKIDVWAPKITNSKFDIAMEVKEEKGRFSFTLEYRTGLFREETIKSMARHFVNILYSVVENPYQEIKDIKMISRDETRQLIYDFNQTKLYFPQDKTIHGIFEEQVKENPEGIAVVFEGEKVTYRELNNKANQIAAILRNKGVGPDNIVGIMIDKSMEMITGIWGILKAGGCYVPIDPDYPTDRIKYMLADSGASILLSRKNLYAKIGFTGDIIELDDKNNYKGDGCNLDNINTPANLAYIIYTSGSTGKPKGVMIEHKALVNLVTWHKNNYEITPGSNCAEYASFSFDASVSQIFSPLTAGATLHILSNDIRLAPAKLNEYFEVNNITYVDLPTEFCEQFMEIVDNRSLRFISTGGDKLKKFKETNYKLVDEYGPTEYTVITTTFPLDKNYDRSPIGKPIANTKVYIVDKYNNLQPVGVPGELCISGAGLARGYLNQKELTDKKFVNNPFKFGKKMYRTGDLARWLPDGNIDFMGRIDYQVKIRGFRIELGEIEQILIKQKGVKNAVVIAKEDKNSNKFLCAYLVCDKKEDIERIKKDISKDIPPYMVPSYFVRLDEMPLTPNAKVDRKALPEPEGQIGDEYIAPVDNKQEKLVKAWQDVLGLDKIGIRDNFFSLGGHSLKAVTLVARLQKEFNVTVNHIFKYQTIEELAKHITPKKDNLKIRLEKLKEGSVLKDEGISKDEDLKKTIVEYNKQTHDKYEKIDSEEKKIYKNILLTGVTGFLGINLLHDLLQQGDVKIHVLIRGENFEKCHERLNNKYKYYFNESTDNYDIGIIQGDLGKERFGLDKKIYDKLSETIDCIINSAANIKHYGVYEDFYTANVKAVENLLTFANNGRKKDFNQISTISVAYGTVKGKNKIIFSENDCDVGQDSDNYYVKTKLEAEKLVIAARNNGINTNIFRLGNIVFNSQSGLYQDNIEDNAFYNKVRAFVNIGAIPASNDEVEFSFVDYISKAILLLFNRKNLLNLNYHIQNSHEVKLSEILNDKDLNLNIDALAFNQFIDYLYDNYEKSGFKTHIETIMLHEGWLGESSGSDFVILSSRTDFILDKLGFKWASPEPAKLRNMIIRSLKERIDFLKDVPIFSELSDYAVQTFATKAREEDYCDETEIVWENDIDDNFYVIMDGNIELKKHSRAGWLGTIGIIGTGEFLGEENLWDDKGSSVIAESIMGEVRLLKLKKDDVIKLLKLYPEFGISLLKEMSDKVRRLESIMVNLG